MPDVITHYLFGLDTSNTIKKSPLYKVIKDNRSVFFVGLQGPDPMYYHLPHKKSNYHYIGSLLHQEKTQDFLLASICFAKNHLSDTSFFESCMAYISGFVCHYILDSMAHPYIFYLSGHFVEDDPSTIIYKGLHRHIELAIDSLILDQKFNLKANSFKVHKYILKNQSLPEPVLKLYHEVLFSIYAIPQGEKVIADSYRDFRNYFKLTYDRMGLKKSMAYLASPLLPKPISPYIGTFSYYRCVNENIDYLNTNKKVWLHPVTGNVYTFSFEDILHNALKKSSAILLAIYDFMYSNVSYDELLELLPDISYLTGLPTTDLRPMRYFDDLSSYKL